MRWVVAAALAVCVGCARGPGRFDITLVWLDGRRPDGADLLMAGRVEHRAVRTEKGTTVAETEAPVPVDATIDFPSVPNGDHLAVVIEVHAQGDPEDLFAYYGVSELFALEPGEIAPVHEIIMRRPPQAPPAPLKAVDLDHEDRHEADGLILVPSENVNLIVTTDTGKSVELSNTRGDIPRSWPLLDLQPVASAELARWSSQFVPWDLEYHVPADPCFDDGSSVPVSARNSCKRPVFVPSLGNQLRHDHGELHARGSDAAVGGGDQRPGPPGST